MRKIIVVIIAAMISSFSYYGAVNEKGEKVVDLTTNIQEENVVENESVEETQGNIIEQIENTIAQAEIIQNEEIKNLEIGFEKENNEKLKEDFRISTEQFYKQKGIAYNWNPNGEYESQNLKSMEEEMNNQVVNIEKHFESQKIVLDEIYHLSD